MPRRSQIFLSTIVINLNNGKPFKVIPFDPKEIRADAYVDNFEQAIRSYYKSDCVTDYIQRQHFFEALSSQQRLAIGCMRIGGTYELLAEFVVRSFLFCGHPWFSRKQALYINAFL